MLLFCASPPVVHHTSTSTLCATQLCHQCCTAQAQPTDLSFWHDGSSDPQADRNAGALPGGAASKPANVKFHVSSSVILVVAFCLQLTTAPLTTPASFSVPELQAMLEVHSGQHAQPKCQKAPKWHAFLPSAFVRGTIWKCGKP